MKGGEMKMMKKKKGLKLLLGLLGMLLITSNVLAIWTFRIEQHAHIDVTSADPFPISAGNPFVDVSLDTTGGSKVNVQYVAIPISEDKAVVINYTLVKEDLPDACNNFENHCTVVLTYGSEDLIPNELIYRTLPGGVDAVFELVTRCVENSCPQTIDASLIVDPV